jgi:hypothetical protein
MGLTAIHTGMVSPSSLTVGRSTIQFFDCDQPERAAKGWLFDLGFRMKHVATHQ